MIGVGVLMLFFYRIDTFDKNLVVHEQAIFLTSSHTQQIRDVIFLDDFIKDLHKQDEF